MSRVSVVGELDRNFAWDGRTIVPDADLAVGNDLPLVRGAAVSVSSNGSQRWRVMRDPLGLNKLFWAQGADGSIAVAANPHRLIEVGLPLDAVYSVPRGTVCELGGPEADSQRSIRPESWFSSASSGPPDLHEIAGDIRTALSGYLEALAVAYPSSPVFVCLSGGLDSSGIAALTREHFADVTAITFDLERPSNNPSDDRAAARRLARDLELPLLETVVTAEELLENLDAVLIAGIDWRDFNVHAALVNAVLAAAVKDTAGAGSPAAPTLVFTGDLANEFLVDYHSEEYRGATFYELPELSPAALRRSLIQGLDTCHREVGVFAAWGIPVVQPYAAATDAYLSIPERFLTLDDRKQELCRMIFQNRLPAYIYERPKVRAQMGSEREGHGVLHACVDHGVDASALRGRFAELHDVADQRALDRFIRAGRYRSKAPSLGSGSEPVIVGRS